MFDSVSLSLRRRALVLLPLLATSPASAAAIRLQEVAAQAGLLYRHQPLADNPGAEMIAGGTVGDFNGDGWPDLFVPGAGTQLDRLFINDRDGTFTDRASEWGLVDLYRGVGAAAADFDRDGDVDLLVTSYGDMPGDPQPGYHRLYRNDGGFFTEVARAAGVNYTSIVHADGFSPVFGDYDLDGDLDLWIGGWHENPETGEWDATRLFRNNGDGSFADVSVEAGVFDPKVRAFSAIFCDMNGDRFPELLVAADLGTTRYFVNNGDGTFSKTSSSSPFLMAGSDLVENGMGTTLADFDNDGLPDWFVTSIYPSYHYLGPDGNRLYLNRGDHRFEMLPEKGGLHDGGWGWGATAVDLDHDGWVDLFHVAGWPGWDIVTGVWFQDDPTRLFRNQGDGTFAEIAFQNTAQVDQGRMAARLDYDRDGDMDLVSIAYDETLKLFRNDLDGPGTNWLQIELTAGDHPTIAPNGRGSRVRIVDDTGRRQVAHLTGHSNYLGGDELVLHFGLAEATRLRTITVLWADGSTTVIEGVAANQRLAISAD